MHAVNADQTRNKAIVSADQRRKRAQGHILCLSLCWQSPIRPSGCDTIKLIYKLPHPQHQVAEPGNSAPDGRWAYLGLACFVERE